MGYLKQTLNMEPKKKLLKTMDKIIYNFKMPTSEKQIDNILDMGN